MNLINYTSNSRNGNHSCMNIDSLAPSHTIIWIHISTIYIEMKIHLNCYFYSRNSSLHLTFVYIGIWLDFTPNEIDIELQRLQNIHVYVNIFLVWMCVYMCVLCIYVCVCVHIRWQILFLLILDQGKTIVFIDMMLDIFWKKYDMK